MALKASILQRELTTYASSKRMYIMRFGYAFILYSFFLFLWSKLANKTLMDVLGKGQDYLDLIEVINFIAIFAVHPFISASLITLEKEKNSLSLLFISNIHPISILLQKCTGAIFTIGAFLIMSFPLVFFSYFLGGIEIYDILISIYFQWITVMQITTVGLMCSCYANKMIDSVITTYAIFVLIYFTIPELVGFHYMHKYHDYSTEILTNSSPTSSFLTETIHLWIPILCSLALAYHFFQKYSFPTQKSLKERYKSWLIQPKKESDLLEPIYWREMPQYKKTFVTIAVTTICILITTIFIFTSSSRDVLSSAASGSCLIIATIKSSIAFSGEFRKQTWEILLVTTMSNHEILSQKSEVVSYFNWKIYFFLVFFTSCFLFFFYDGFRYKSQIYVITVYSFVFSGAVLYTIQRVCMWLSIRFISNRALPLITIILLVCWNAFPVFLNMVVQDIVPWYLSEVFVLFSPLGGALGLAKGTLTSLSGALYGPTVIVAIHTTIALGAYSFTNRYHYMDYIRGS